MKEHEIEKAVIETERLLLRPTKLEDFDGWAELMADPAASRFIGGPVPRAAAWRGMMTMAGSWSAMGFGMFSLIEKSSGRWIGRVGPWQPEGWPGTEVGWGLVTSAQGHGFAYEAAVASIDWAFATLGWDAVIHTIDPDNRASIILAERLGSVHQGRTQLPAPFEHFRVDKWGQSRADWLARRAGT